MFEEILGEMRVDDFVKLQSFHDLAHEALEAEKIVKKVFLNAFPGDKPIEVYHYESFSEYYAYATLSKDGLWQYHDNWWGGRHWEVECTANGIYELFRDAYIGNTDERASEKCIFSRTPAEHFRRFIKETLVKLDS